MYSKRERSLGGLADLVLLMLERGITISEGKRAFTLSLGDGRPVRQDARATPRLVPVPALPGRKARKPARKLKTAKAIVKARPAKSVKAELPAPVLPTPLAIFAALEKNKIKGLKVSDMAKLFELSRIQMKKALEPLIKAGKIEFFNKTKSFLPIGKLRGKGFAAKPGASRKREKPVATDRILEVLKAAGQPLDRHAIAKQLDVNYHRLIRRMDALVRENVIKAIGNTFTMP